MSLLYNRFDVPHTKAEKHDGRYALADGVTARDVLDTIEASAADHGYDVDVWAVGAPRDEAEGLGLGNYWRLENGQYHHNASDARYILNGSDLGETEDAEEWVYGNPETLADVEGYKVRLIEGGEGFVGDVIEDLKGASPTFVDFYVPGEADSDENVEELTVWYESGKEWKLGKKDGASQTQQLVATVTEKLGH